MEINTSSLIVCLPKKWHLKKLHKNHIHSYVGLKMEAHKDHQKNSHLFQYLFFQQECLGIFEC